MEIGSTTVDDDTVYFIAEAGVNHNGDLGIAERLVDAAADAGADAVKFQTFTADRLVTPSAQTVDYQEETTGEETQLEMLEQYELDETAHERLVDYCDERDITFLSTPFDRESATLLDDLGLPAIKIGSGELDNLPLLEYVAELGRPMIVSTGMGTLSEVRTAYDAIRSGDEQLPLVLLHCTSVYPARMDEVNLRAMQTLDDEFPVPIGYSDHTTAVETPGFAVAAGATFVEKHFTLDRTLPGPDHEASLEPDELADAVSIAIEAARAKGSADKEPAERELENRSVIRKSLHAATAVDAGDELTEENVGIVRPADGLPPADRQRVLGTKVTKPLRPGEAITENVLSEE
jgi:N-acetylneuraminate synthase/N,N'-diacetyllegionaminate synthase